MIQEIFEKMDCLINDILSCSSISSDELSSEEVNMYEAVNEVKKLIYIPKYIDIKINKTFPVIKADKVRIQQLFQNLMSTTVNYIDKEKGFITIDFEEKD